MTKTDNTVGKRVERYTERQLQRRLVRVHPWVPLNRREELLGIAEKMREEEAAAQVAEAG